MNTNTEANVTVEILFRAEKAHVNLFLDLTLDVVFTDPGGAQKNLVNDPEYVSLHRELKDRLTEQIILCLPGICFVLVSTKKTFVKKKLIDELN